MANKHIGLFFGTFNPIHIGHLILGNYIAQLPEVDQVWFVVTPRSPTKLKKTLLADVHRLALVKEAIEDNPLLEASNIEFNLPKPNFTVDTLEYLTNIYPDKEFSLIMGQDNLRGLHKWKNNHVILDRYHIRVYPRLYTASERNACKIIQKTDPQYTQVEMVDAPLMHISSSTIRIMLKQGKDVQYLLHPKVYAYIQEMNFYKK